MTTFARISDNETPSIVVHSDAKLSKINDNIYGGFLEHMGRCIYGGIFDPDSPLADENGFRKDVIDALKELRIPVVRYPGGNFVATYHWEDGVGPREKRPTRRNLAWNGGESNIFGTDEFMKWCEAIGTAPYLCLNFGTGTLDEALNWLEYCNSSQNTYYANLRRQNGREQPYNVKYWALGNEVYGSWQVGQMSKEAYAVQAWQWAKALKLADPSITLILCGETGFAAWDSYVMKECIRIEAHALSRGKTKPTIDMYSIHGYTADDEHYANATGPKHIERAIQICASFIDHAHIVNNLPSTVKKPTICFDEWNVWSPLRAPGQTGAEESYTLSDALAIGIWLNTFIRQSKLVQMANLAQSVNVISPLMTSKAGISKQPTWWPLLLFSKYMRGHTIALTLRSPEYEGPTNPDWLRGTIETPFLDASATIDDEGYVNLAVVNIHDSKAFSTSIKGIALSSAEKVMVYQVAGADVQRDATASAEKALARHVKLKESSWDASNSHDFSFNPLSLTLLRWSTG